MSCASQCFVALSQGAMGWSAVCDCGTSWSYSLAFSPGNIPVEVKKAVVGQMVSVSFGLF